METREPIALIVDDKGWCAALPATARPAGMRARTCRNVMSAGNLLSKETVGLVVFSQNLPGAEVLLRVLVKEHPEVPRFVTVDSSNIALAHMAVQDGVLDGYMVGPCSEEDLDSALSRGLAGRSAVGVDPTGAATSQGSAPLGTLSSKCP
jgi:DNA-binding NtrC family response regulator